MKKKKIRIKRKKEAKSKPKPTIRVSHSEIHEIIRQLNSKHEKKAVPETPIKQKKKQSAEKPEKDARKDERAKLDYKNNLVYNESHSVNYRELFSYLGREFKDPYKSYVAGLEEKKKRADPEPNYDELERIIRRDHVSSMVCIATDRMDIDEIERYKYWKETHKMWNMLLIDMLSVGQHGAGKGFLYF